MKSLELLLAKLVELLSSIKFWSAIGSGLLYYLDTSDWRKALGVTVAMLWGGRMVEDVGKAKQRPAPTPLPKKQTVVALVAIAAASTALMFTGCNMPPPAEPVPVECIDEDEADAIATEVAERLDALPADTKKAEAEAMRDEWIAELQKGQGPCETL